jgi:hypothetical protein
VLLSRIRIATQWRGVAMPNESLTLVLTGDVPLDKFQQAVIEWRELISLLTQNVAGDSEITWLIDDLRPGSALITVRGESPRESKAAPLPEIGRAYVAVGRSLEQGTEMPYPGQIANHAHRLQQLINGGIEGIRLSTDEEDAIIPPPTVKVTDAMREQAVAGSFGAVEGRIETLGRRKGLHFTLYDSVQDRAVSCYVLAGNEDMMRDIWGKYAVVEGWIRRDPISGRPQTVRRIENVTVLPDRDEQDGFEQARGVVNLGDESAEKVIRRIRDAW